MGSLKVKTITYKPNGEKPGDNSGFDPFYGGEGENLIPFPRDRIVPWWEDDDEAKEGIISHLAQMTENELRELYGGYLVPKGYREQDIMEMPIKDLENLFNQVMNI
jgi:hypothetical protein|tara:strand:+ start:447 stop:764 length:318 start_codon:yes stop_codon:yes gene_type:complete